MTIATRPLGRTGTDVTVLGYGAMELRGRPWARVVDDQEAGRLLNAVLDGGISLIDTSIDYGGGGGIILGPLARPPAQELPASTSGGPPETPAPATAPL